MGLGAVISHEMPDGTHRPVAYASRTLSKSERNYAQIEKEALALVFGVKKFHDFLYTHPFVLVTDHKVTLNPHHSWTKEGSSNTSCCKDAMLGADIGVPTAIQVY